MKDKVNWLTDLTWQWLISLSEKKSQNIGVNEHVGAGSVFEGCTAQTHVDVAQSLINCCKESQIESLDLCYYKAMVGLSIKDKWHGYC